MTERRATTTEAWLVLRAQSGDRQALEELIDRVQERLYRYVLGLVREPHLAENVLQEVLLRVYRKLRWLRDPRVFRTWAYRIATREAYRHLSRERRWNERVGDDAHLTRLPAPAAPQELSPEEVARLYELTAGLPPACGAVVTLHYLHELTLEQTASALEIPIGTAKSRLAYGLQRLRDALAPEGEPGAGAGRAGSEGRLG